MNTIERAEHLARAAAQFEYLGISDPAQLIETVRCELGHERVLDELVPYAGHHSMASCPGTILHVISGNTPHAGLQSLIRGLLLGSHNLCKIPSAGLPEIAQFRAALPPELAERVEISAELSDQWIARAGAVIVFGSDETIAALQARVRPSQIFIPHGHKVSFGMVFDDPRFDSLGGAARDASVFDQQGCLSPHLFYIRGDAAEYAARLAGAMAEFEAHTPRGALTAEEAAAVFTIRAGYEFRASNDPGIAVYQSTGSTGWTVILDSDPAFAASCLNRVVFVKPMPDDVVAALAQVRPFLSTVGIWPATAENARKVVGLGVSRICPIGRMQSPPFSWHQDGWQNLASLVRWIDAESLDS